MDVRDGEFSGTSVRGWGGGKCHVINRAIQPLVQDAKQVRCSDCLVHGRRGFVQ